MSAPDEHTTAVSGSACRDSVRIDGPRLVLAVRVTPRANRDEMTCEGGIVRVRLHAPPVEGAANEALIAFVARRLGLPKRNVRLERGATSREKLLAVTGLPLDEFWRRLAL